MRPDTDGTRDGPGEPVGGEMSGPNPVAPTLSPAQRGAQTPRVKGVLGSTPLGRLALALLDVWHASESAKSRAANGLRYRDYGDGSRYRRLNYHSSRQARARDYAAKQEALRRACGLAAEAGVGFGWKGDAAAAAAPWVAYFDLPCGQVSLHATARGDGPDYGGEWDGQRLTEERLRQTVQGLTGERWP